MAKYFRSTLTNRQQKNLSFIFRCVVVSFFFIQHFVVILHSVNACTVHACECVSVMLYHSDLPLLPVTDVMTTVAIAIVVVGGGAGAAAAVIARCVAVAASAIAAFGYLLNFHCTTSLSFTRTHLR